MLFSDGFETAFPDPGNTESSAANRAYMDHFSAAAARALGEHAGAAEAAALIGEDLAGQTGSLSQRDDLTALLLMRAADRLSLPMPTDTDRAAA